MPASDSEKKRKIHRAIPPAPGPAPRADRSPSARSAGSPGSHRAAGQDERAAPAAPLTASSPLRNPLAAGAVLAREKAQALARLLDKDRGFMINLGRFKYLLS